MGERWGSEPTTLGTTIRCSNQLQLLYHIRLSKFPFKTAQKDRYKF